MKTLAAILLAVTLTACGSVPTASTILDKTDLKAATLDERSARACYVGLAYAMVLSSEHREDKAADYGRLSFLLSAATTLKQRIDQFGQPEIDLARYQNAFLALFGRALQARVSAGMDISGIAGEAADILAENTLAVGGLTLAKRKLDELRAGMITVDEAWTACLLRMAFELDQLQPS